MCRQPFHGCDPVNIVGHLYQPLMTEKDQTVRTEEIITGQAAGKPSRSAGRQDVRRACRVVSHGDRCIVPQKNRPGMRDLFGQGLGIPRGDMQVFRGDEIGDLAGLVLPLVRMTAPNSSSAKRAASHARSCRSAFRARQRLRSWPRSNRSECWNRVRVLTPRQQIVRKSANGLNHR